MVSLLYRDHELTGVFNFDKVGGIGHATAFNLGGGGVNLSQSVPPNSLNPHPFSNWPLNPLLLLCKFSSNDIYFNWLSFPVIASVLRRIYYTYFRALDIRTKAYGPNHHDVGQTLLSYSSFLLNLDAIKSAETAIRAAEILEVNWRTLVSLLGMQLEKQSFRC